MVMHLPFVDFFFGGGLAGAGWAHLQSCWQSRRSGCQWAHARTGHCPSGLFLIILWVGPLPLGTSARRLAAGYLVGGGLTRGGGGGACRPPCTYLIPAARPASRKHQEPRRHTRMAIQGMHAAKMGPSASHAEPHPLRWRPCSPSGPWKCCAVWALHERHRPHDRCPRRNCCRLPRGAGARARDPEGNAHAHPFFRPISDFRNQWGVFPSISIGVCWCGPTCCRGPTGFGPYGCRFFGT